MIDPKKEHQVWREVKYANKFRNAFRGISIFAKTTKHFPLQFGASVCAVFLGFYFHVSGLEWVALVFAIGLVIISEAFNTAIEIDIDLTSPEYHPYARDTKDVSAAAVLLASFVAAIVGIIIFVPKIW